MSEPVHRMLVIEDNVGDAFLLSEHLRDVTGAPEVVIRRNLAEGLDLAASGGFSAVLLDLSLPDSYGLDTLRRVRSALPGVPVIVLTGLEDEQLRDEILGAGAKGYLVKGAATADILQAIARAIA
jgi:DNA-binding NarL/FixJ family response regulator